MSWREKTPNRRFSHVGLLHILLDRATKTVCFSTVLFKGVGGSPMPPWPRHCYQMSSFVKTSLRKLRMKIFQNSIAWNFTGCLLWKWLSDHFFAFSSHKARNDFIRTIHHTMHESMRHISIGGGLKAQHNRLQHQSAALGHQRSLHHHQHQHQHPCAGDMDNTASSKFLRVLVYRSKLYNIPVPVPVPVPIHDAWWYMAMHLVLVSVSK